MSKSEEFVDYYNQIDAFLKKESGNDFHEAFSLKVRNSKNKAVKKYKDDLLSFGELRNAIVHNPRIGNKTIAEPHEEIVKKIKELYKEISNPEKVFPRFERKIYGVKESDYINRVLVEMKQNSYSQIPVYDQNKHVISLVNTNTIAWWLSSVVEKEGTINIDNVTISDLIKEIEHQKNYKFISKNTSIYDAYGLFIDQIHKEKRNLDVLLITENGKKTETLLGLITISDIAEIAENA